MIKRLFYNIKELYNKASGHRKLGLLYEDLFSNEYPEVAEAVRRLPENIRKAREMRIHRAYDLDFKGKILPKEQWTKPEEDVPYLTPILEQVLKEQKERKAFRRG